MVLLSLILRVHAISHVYQGRYVNAIHGNFCDSLLRTPWEIPCVNTYIILGFRYHFANNTFWEFP